MKELSIEEKAKAYDKAIERAKYYYSTTDSAADIKLIGLMFPELKESEDKKMIQYFKDLAPFDNADELYEKYGFSHKDAISWLEKQGGHAKFINGIQVGDKVTRNEDGVLVNLSQLNRVAKKQGEQKYIPKYKIGDYVKNTNYKGEPIYEIVYMDKECYICEYRGKEKMGDKAVMHFSFDNPYLRLVEQKPAWSEEDEKHIMAIDLAVNRCLGKWHCCGEKCPISEHNPWLKDLKDRYTWKPSDEQIEAVKEAACYSSVFSEKTIDNLISLSKQLKKLKS